MRRQPRDADQGFTLVELLVVFVVLGILAAIVAPTLLRQREKAWRAALRSDLRSAASAQEAWASEHGGYVLPGPASLDQLRAEGYRPSPDVVLTVVDDDMQGVGGGYCLRAEHAALGVPGALYLAATGPEGGRATSVPCVAS